MSTSRAMFCDSEFNLPIEKRSAEEMEEARKRQKTGKDKFHVIQPEEIRYPDPADELDDAAALHALIHQ